MQIKVDFLCRDSILAAPIALDLVLFLDLAKRAPELRSIGIQEWLSFYLKSPQTAEGLYPEHDLFIQSMKLKNTLRHIMGAELITHLGLEYYDWTFEPFLKCSVPHPFALFLAKGWEAVILNSSQQTKSPIQFGWGFRNL